MTDKTLAQFLADRMNERGVGVNELAFYSKIGSAGIYRILRGQHYNLLILSLERLAISLEVELGTLAQAALNSRDAALKSLDQRVVPADHAPMEADNNAIS